jgi:hypothetical protein
MDMQLSWFPFFLFDTDWMGREVLRGDPKGLDPLPAIYDQGVRIGAFGLLLNSVGSINPAWTVRCVVVWESKIHIFLHKKAGYKAFAC